MANHTAASPEHCLPTKKLRSLKRRAAELPGQIERWIRSAAPGEALSRNRSQLEALWIFMSRLIDRTTGACARVETALGADAEDPAALEQLDQVEAALFRSQRVWGFFRDKLAQRFVPETDRILALTDVVAHDCYHTAKRSAERQQLGGTFGDRDYPLVCFADYGASPFTWARNVVLQGLEDRMLPVPVVCIPWDHAANPWELLWLHHEVSHDIDADLGRVSTALGAGLEAALLNAGVPPRRASSWRRWTPEIFADALGILLGGPPLVSFIAGYLTSSPMRSLKLSPDAVHPPPYLRVRLDAQLAARLDYGAGGARLAREVEAAWNARFAGIRPAAADYLDDFGTVLDQLLGPLPGLGKAEAPTRLTDIVPVSPKDFDDQVRGGEALLAGKSLPTELKPRLAVGAAHLAFDAHRAPAPPAPDPFPERLIEGMVDHARRAAPGPQYPLRTERSTRHLRALADAVFEGSGAGSVDGDD